MDLFTCQPAVEVCEDSFSNTTIRLTLAVLTLLVVRVLTWAVARCWKRLRRIRR